MDVVGSREATPVPEKVEVAPDRVSVELESLSKASRQFLEVRETLGQIAQARTTPFYFTYLDTSKVPANFQSVQLGTSKMDTLHVFQRHPHFRGSTN